ncbi:MAG: hypothetical protein KF886_09870 [Candidatus Hydrogenedentes bacterium]|nr:hypothetical protein [Candidatus Hydrogenedentota bacterium]
MIFICPHCEEHLQIRPQFLGFRGYCKKCGGRIALIGSRNILTAQLAQKLGPREFHTPNPEPEGPGYVGGGIEAALDGISDWDDEVVTDFEDASEAEAPPTPEQIARIRDLGATEAQIARVATKGDAVRLIEVLQPPPTREQLEILRAYGVTDDELTFLTTAGVAQAMIDEYESDNDASAEDEEEEDMDALEDFDDLMGDRP